jgi:hypothetical protein
MRDLYKVPRIFAGKTVVIIGGGPSLDLKQVRKIAIAHAEGKIGAIAVNDAGFVCWFADWLHACDFKFWNWNKQSATRFPGIRTTLDEHVPAGWAALIKNTGREGFDENPSHCRTGSNSAYQAAHCAIHAGARKIVLVGVDQKLGPKGESHWYGEPPDRIVPHYETAMIPYWDGLKDALKAFGVEMVNATPGSALKSFPLAGLDEVLK